LENPLVGPSAGGFPQQNPGLACLISQLPALRPGRPTCLETNKSKLYSISSTSAADLDPSHSAEHVGVTCVKLHGFPDRSALPAAGGGTALLFFLFTAEIASDFRDSKEPISFPWVTQPRNSGQRDVAATHKKNYEQWSAGCQRFCVCAMQEDVFPVLFKGL
jgi:hypothetical protein